MKIVTYEEHCYYYYYYYYYYFFIGTYTSLTPVTDKYRATNVILTH